MTLNNKIGFLLTVLRFRNTIHISIVNCAEVARC